MLAIKNLNYKVEGFSLKIDRLEIKPSGITLLVGDSGSGKSTLLNTIMGLVETNFECLLSGTNIAKKAIKEKNLGVVFQDVILFDHMTASKNCFFAADARNNKLSQEQLESWFEKAGIKDCYNKKAINMSGGERQRLAILRALSGKPKAIIMDEPFSALDENNKLKLFRLISDYAKENNIPALIASHEYSDIEKEAIGLVHLKQGQLI